jgi:hypothetical protein
MSEYIGTEVFDFTTVKGEQRCILYMAKPSADL